MTLLENNHKFRSGQWIKQSGPEPYSCFIPAPLPPNPPLHFSAGLQTLEEQASLALGRLDAVTTFLPDPNLFLYTYVRKEAVLSSQIEGTQSSLSDLLIFENKETPGVPISDVKEVSNYVAAMSHGLKRLNQDNFPLSLRLIKEIHAILLKEGRGANKEPGEFRRSQNWVGGSRPGNATYVPPPPHEVLPAMGALEKFIHGDPVQTPALIKAGLIHAQFESIHPFLDGNGRLGRLLITFLLCSEKVLSQPLLYLSIYFKRNRQEYYAQLQKVRMEGDWEGWLSFYLHGVKETAAETVEGIHKLLQMFHRHEEEIKNLGRSSATAIRLFDYLKKQPVISPATVSKKLKISPPTINQAIERFQKIGIVKEITGRQAFRLYAYDPYLKALSKGMDEAAG